MTQEWLAIIYELSVLYTAVTREEAINIGRAADAINIGRAVDAINIGRAADAINIGRAVDAINTGMAVGASCAVGWWCQHVQKWNV